MQYIYKYIFTEFTKSLKSFLTWLKIKYLIFWVGKTYRHICKSYGASLYAMPPFWPCNQYPSQVVIELMALSSCNYEVRFTMMLLSVPKMFLPNLLIMNGTYLIFMFLLNHLKMHTVVSQWVQFCSDITLLESTKPHFCNVWLDIVGPIVKLISEFCCHLICSHPIGPLDIAIPH